MTYLLPEQTEETEQRGTALQTGAHGGLWTPSKPYLFSVQPAQPLVLHFVISPAKVYFRTGLKVAAAAESRTRTRSSKTTCRMIPSCTRPAAESQFHPCLLTCSSVQQSADPDFSQSQTRGGRDCFCPLLLPYLGRSSRSSSVDFFDPSLSLLLTQRDWRDYGVHTDCLFAPYPSLSSHHQPVRTPWTRSKPGMLRPRLALLALLALPPPVLPRQLANNAPSTIPQRPERPGPRSLDPTGRDAFDIRLIRVCLCFGLLTSHSSSLLLCALVCTRTSSRILGDGELASFGFSQPIIRIQSNLLIVSLTLVQCRGALVAFALALLVSKFRTGLSESHPSAKNTITPSVPFGFDRFCTVGAIPLTP